MKKILSDITYQQTLSRQGKEKAARFSWKNTADGLLEVYRNRTAAIFDVPFFSGTMEEALQKLNDLVKSKKIHHVAFINAHCLNLAYKDAAYKQVLKECPVVFADGIGAKIGAAMLGYKVEENVNGTEKSVLTMSYWGLQSETYKNTKFRCIVSFTSVTDLTDTDQWQVGLTLLLVDLDSNTEAFKLSTKLKIAKNKLGDTFASVDDFKGNIVLYGRPYQTTKLDKIYPIFKGKSPNVVKTELSAQ